MFHILVHLYKYIDINKASISIWIKIGNFSLHSNGTNVKQESNPFEEEEWDEDSGEPLVDNGEPGVLVRALYDYEGAEADELSFKQGII